MKIALSVHDQLPAGGEGAAELVDAAVRGARVRDPGRFVERDRVDLRVHPGQQAGEAHGVGVRIVRAGHQHVLERNAPAAAGGKAPAGGDQVGESVFPVHGNQRVAQLFRGGVQ